MLELNQQKTLLRFFKAVGQPVRLHMLGLLAGRSYTVPELASAMDLKETAVAKHLRRLQAIDLVAQEAGTTFRFRPKKLEQLSRDLFHHEKETRTERVFRHYLDGQKVKALPENEEELQIILSWLVQKFEPETHYSEKRVNAILKRHNVDHAMVRRMLVDYGYMARERGIYWRVEKEL